MRIVYAICIYCMLCTSGQAFATLGGKLASVTTDQTRFKATVLATDSGTYTNHILTLDGGMVVHEYSGSDGIVFAVSWQGPVVPDLKQLLGDYFATVVDLRQASTSHRQGLSQFHSQQSSIVIHVGGHFGAFSGLVYLPGRLPSGLDAEALQ